MIPSMHCTVEMDGVHYSLMEEWMPWARGNCGECRDDPEGFVAADPHKDCSMVHSWWNCEDFDSDFNGVARWVWELCPMSCGKCPDPTPVPPYMPFVPEAGHDASKCREWGHFDDDCCAEHHATSCADGFTPVLSEHVCDPNNHARVTYYSCIDGVPPTNNMWFPAAGHDASKCRERGHFDDDCCSVPHDISCADGYQPEISDSYCSHEAVFYSCVAPGHLNAPADVSGQDAKEVFRGLLETTERLAKSMNLPHDLVSWEKMAWERRRLAASPFLSRKN